LRGPEFCGCGAFQNISPPVAASLPRQRKRYGADAMEYFPIFLDLKGRPALVVGGGELALRKLRLLHKAGARVTVVAPRIAAEIAASGAALKRRGFVDGDVGGQTIVFGATGIDAGDDRVATAACRAASPG